MAAASVRAPDACGAVQAGGCVPMEAHPAELQLRVDATPHPHGVSCVMHGRDLPRDFFASDGPAARFAPISGLTRSVSTHCLAMDWTLPVEGDGPFDFGFFSGRSRLFIEGRQVAEAVSGAPLSVGRAALTFLAGRLARERQRPLTAHVVVDLTEWEGGLRYRRPGTVPNLWHCPATKLLPERVVVAPSGCAPQRPLVLALPGWNGSPYSFMTSRWVDEAVRRQWWLLLSETGGNVLYTGAIEQKLMHAMAVAERDWAVDRRRSYVTGFSMGGAGALQLAHHFPDRFAAAAAFFGDSRYDLHGYVRGILRTQSQADRYSVLLFPQNVSELPVLLVHAKDDPVTPLSESQALADAYRQLGIRHDLIAPDRGGHRMEVVEQYAGLALDYLAQAQRPELPEVVRYATYSSDYAKAYWLSVTLKHDGTLGRIVARYDAQEHRVRIEEASGLMAVTIHTHELPTHERPPSIDNRADPALRVYLVGDDAR